jgi:SAM-dependent methyltransferase
MDEQQLIQSWEAEAQEPFAGWDFSHLEGRYHEETPPWSYTEKVRAVLTQADSLLDMGTGGGEKLLEFKDLFPAYTAATEGYPPNLPVAKAALEPHGVDVLPYDSEQDARMPYDDARFALVLNRHEAYDAAEIKRILRPGGVFITQQVDGRDMADLYTLFGVETAYGHVTLANFRAGLESAGLSIQEALDWQGKATFTDVGALVYYLCAVPWEAPTDFSVQRYREQLLMLHARPKLEFTIRRFYLQAIKPG